MEIYVSLWRHLSNRYIVSSYHWFGDSPRWINAALIWSLYRLHYTFKDQKCNPLLSLLLFYSCFIRLLFLVYLNTIFRWLILYSVEWKDDIWMMHWKGCERKRSWNDLMYYHVISQYGVRKPWKECSQNSRFPGRDFNARPPIRSTSVYQTRHKVQAINNKFFEVNGYIQL
jgi:hypothetical protein